MYRTYHSFNWKGLEFCWTQNWAETPASHMDSAVYVDFCSLAPLVQKTRPQLNIENSEVSAETCWCRNGVSTYQLKDVRSRSLKFYPKNNVFNLQGNRVFLQVQFAPATNPSTTSPHNYHNYNNPKYPDLAKLAFL